MSPAGVIERLGAICMGVGFDIHAVKPAVVARMQLLAEHTETVTDSEHMASMAREFFRYHEAKKPLEAFSEGERRIVALGCLFADIGKTGPSRADWSAQTLIVEMFAVEGVRDEAQAVTEFLNTHFPADADDRIRRFEALGLDSKMRIREFWNLHSTWTLEILEASGVPPEAIAAAVAHHLLDDVNPEAIVAEDRRFTRPSGDNAMFDRAEKLIIVLDKYDALRRRGRRTHDQAITWLRDRVESNPRFRGDTEFLTLIEDFDASARS